MTATVTIDLDTFGGKATPGRVITGRFDAHMVYPSGSIVYTDPVDWIADSQGRATVQLVADVLYRVTATTRPPLKQTIGPLNDGQTYTLASLLEIEPGVGSHEASIIASIDELRDAIAGLTAAAEPRTVSGSVTVDATRVAHELTLSGDAFVSVQQDEAPLGTLLGIRVHTDGHALTVLGRPIDADGDITIGLQYWSDGWSLLAGVAAGDPVPDTTAPTAGTMAVTPGSSTATGTVSGALDETRLNSAPYAFSKDNGATWSAWQSSASFTWTGLTPGTSYTFRHKVRDGGGNETVGAGVAATTTTVLTFGNLSTWAFTAADNTELNGIAATTGAAAGTLTAPPSVPAASPPTLINVMGNRAHFRATGGAIDLLFRSTTDQARGLALEVDTDLASTSYLLIGIGTNSDASNRVCFQIEPSGAVTLNKVAQGTASYTPASGSPTVPRVGRVRAEFVKNADGSCTGKLLSGSTLIGTIEAAGWTWFGRHIISQVLANQVDAYLDNVTFQGAM